MFLWMRSPFHVALDCLFGGSSVTAKQLQQLPRFHRRRSRVQAGDAEAPVQRNDVDWEGKGRSTGEDEEIF